MSLLRRIRRHLADASGYTLVELLMATVIGIGVLMVTYELSDAVLHAQTQISDRTESIARGRTAMEQIVQQLRSQVCLGPGQAAIAYGDDHHLTFYADLADTTFVPEERDLDFSGGALTENDYAGSPSAGATPYTFSAVPSRTRVIADDLLLQLDSSGAQVPFFTYYSFDNNTPVRPDNQLATPLDPGDAARVVLIRVSFAALPTRGGSSASSPGEPFSSNVFVRTADPSDPARSPLCI
jgi:hypothetical protein